MQGITKSGYEEQGDFQSAIARIFDVEKIAHDNGLEFSFQKDVLLK